jgi:hypothetical protein
MPTPTEEYLSGFNSTFNTLTGHAMGIVPTQAPADPSIRPPPTPPVSNSTLSYRFMIAVVSAVLILCFLLWSGSFSTFIFVVFMFVVLTAILFNYLDICS